MRVPGAHRNLFGADLVLEPIRPRDNRRHQLVDSVASQRRHPDWLPRIQTAGSAARPGNEIRLVHHQHRVRLSHARPDLGRQGVEHGGVPDERRVRIDQRQDHGVRRRVPRMKCRRSPFGGGISPESDRAILRGPGGLW